MRSFREIRRTSKRNYQKIQYKQQIVYKMLFIEEGRHKYPSNSHKQLKNPSDSRKQKQRV